MNYPIVIFPLLNSTTFSSESMSDVTSFIAPIVLVPIFYSFIKS